MFKNLLTGLVLLGAVEIASATYQDGQTTERPQVILRYNTAGGVEGVETRTLTNKIIYRSEMDGFDGVGNGPALQYKNVFFLLPELGEQFDFSKNDWRYPVGSVEGTIVNLLVGAQDDWERRIDELKLISQAMKGFEGWQEIDPKVQAAIKDPSNFRLFFNSGAIKYRSPFSYVYTSEDLTEDVPLYYASSPYYFLNLILGGTFDKDPTARTFRVLDTYLRDLSDFQRANTHRALVNIPNRRSEFASLQGDLILTDTPDTGPIYVLGGRFDTPTVLPNGYVFAGLAEKSRRAPVQVILDTLNFALKMKFPGLSEDQKGQAFYDMIQKFSQANQASILLTQKNYSSYLKAFHQILPQILMGNQDVMKIQEYLVNRARAANLVADSKSLDKGLDELVKIDANESDQNGSTLFVNEKSITDRDGQLLIDVLGNSSNINTYYQTRTSQSLEMLENFTNWLQTNKSLQVIGFDVSNIGDPGAEAFARALKGNATLKTLYLDSNNISDVGASALADSLKENKSLKELSLNSNNIGDTGAKALLDLVAVNKDIKIYLSKNGLSEEMISELEATGSFILS